MTRSKHLTWPAVVLLVLLAGLVGHSTSANRMAAPISPAVVATIDLERLFQGLAERGAADAQLTAVAADLDAQGQQRREEIDLLSQDLDLYAPGSTQYQQTAQQAARKGYELQAFLDFAMRKLDAEKARTLRAIYDHIKRAVGAVSAENGYDIVLVDDSIVDLPFDATEAETMRQISARRMLYGNPQIDITEEVAARMNEDFNRQQGG